MPIRVPHYPYDFGRNRTYLHLMNTYTQQDSWNIKQLEKKFGTAFTTQVVNSGFLVPERKNQDTGQLAFKVCGTVSRLIVQLVENEICSFKELRNKLPQYNKPSSSKLKNLLSFLVNFRQIQTFTCPITSITAVTGDRDLLELTIDDFYGLSDFQDQRFLYKVDPDDSLIEIKRLREAQQRNAI